MSKITNLESYFWFILLNQSMTSSVFFHWFKLNLCLSSLSIACIINLLNLSSSFLAGFISCTDELFWKFSLWSDKNVFIQEASVHQKPLKRVGNNHKLKYYNSDKYNNNNNNNKDNCNSNDTKNDNIYNHDKCKFDHNDD